MTLVKLNLCQSINKTETFAKNIGHLKWSVLLFRLITESAGILDHDIDIGSKLK